MVRELRIGKSESVGLPLRDLTRINHLKKIDDEFNDEGGAAEDSSTKIKIGSSMLMLRIRDISVFKRRYMVAV